MATVTTPMTTCMPRTLFVSVRRCRPMFRLASRPGPVGTAANSSSPASSSAGMYFTFWPEARRKRRLAPSQRCCRPVTRPWPALRAFSEMSDTIESKAPSSSSPPGTSRGLPHLGQGRRRPALVSDALSFFPQDEQ